MDLQPLLDSIGMPALLALILFAGVLMFTSFLGLVAATIAYESRNGYVNLARTMGLFAYLGLISLAALWFANIITL